MRVIIIAAGESTRWGNHLGYAKHVIPVFGERLLDRTIRLLRDEDLTLDIQVIVRPEDREWYLAKGATTVDADLDLRRFDADKFLSSRSVWESTDFSDTIILYGDCFFTRDAIRTILTTPCDDRGWEVFARFQSSDITGSEWGEVFAFRFQYKYLPYFELVCEVLVEEYLARTLWRIGGWEVYSLLSGGDLDSPGVYNGVGVEIDDWTEDFDFPSDYSKWSERAILAGYTGKD